MRKKLISTLVAIALVGVLVLAGCVPEVAPGAAPSSLIPNRDNTYDIGRSNKQWNDLYLYRYIVTANGTANITMPSGNVTLSSLTGTDTLTNKTLTSANLTTPNIHGTPTRTNVAMGTVQIESTSTSATVTHGLASTPTLILLTFATSPGDNQSVLYWGNAGVTTFTANVASNTTAAANITWQAFIAAE